jgi:hypothetical protein
VTDLNPLVKSHPSVHVRRLLASAELDVPAPGAKERALVALARADHRLETTNFSGIALGTTVNRLIGAVTLYGSAASPWRLLARGSFMGAAAGAMALVAVVTLRWVEATPSAGRVAPLSGAPSLSDARPSELTHEAREQALLRGAAVELDAGHPAIALESIEALLRSIPSAKVLPQATLLKAKSLLRLGRAEEAKAAAAALLNAAPCPESTELRALLESQPVVPAATSAQ